MHDIDGNECTLDALCRKEPEWAVSRIRDLETKLAAAEEKAEKVEAEEIQRIKRSAHHRDAAMRLANEYEAERNAIRRKLEEERTCRAEIEALTRRVVEQQAEVEKANTSAIFSYNRWGDALREIDVLRAKLAAAKEENQRLREAFGVSEPWPVMSILRCLADAADELLTRHSYDGHGHEEVSHCRDKARDRADAIDAALRATLASTAPEDKDDAED